VIINPFVFGSVLPASNRYWRLYITDNFVSTFTVLGELDLFIGGVEATYTGTPTEVGGFGSPFVPANAFDNDHTTAWASEVATLPCSVGFDFGAGNDKAITSFGIRARDVNGAQAPKTFTLQGSADAVTWFTYATYASEPSWANDEYRAYAFN
jgi:hypothetical protein